MGRVPSHLIISSRSCRNQSLMHLLQCLFFMEAQLQFELTSTHIAGVHNTLADDLSHNWRSSFLSKAPWVTPHPSPAPVQLVALLLDPSLDWMSPSWTQQFSTIYCEKGLAETYNAAIKCFLSFCQLFCKNLTKEDKCK